MNNQNVKNFFDQIAISYRHEENDVMEELLNALEIGKCQRILDLGCGKGIISTKLADRSKGEVIALDISSKMIECAKENINHPSVTFICGDYYEYKDRKKFDAIICFDAFPHFLDVDGFVKKASKLLNDNGLLAIIHDCGRGHLNTHHAAYAQKVSRRLLSPEEESLAFTPLFKIIALEESEDYYKMIFIKK